jgi:5-(carboxyamino)imidazole ribonucleotide synthase
MGDSVMRIAIVGCGQLSRMMALAGIPFGIQFSFINDSDNDDTRCVDGLGKVVKLTDYWQEGQDAQRLFDALEKPDCVTVEKEQVDIKILEVLAPLTQVNPCVDAVKACQHRHNEKSLLARLTIPSSPSLYCVTANEAMEKLNLPMVVKSCSDGYDGKNQWVLKTVEDVENFDKLTVEDYIIEAWIKFEREVSIVSVRGLTGDIVHYTLTENLHTNGILIKSIAPAPHITDALTQKAQSYMESILVDLNYVGVMAMECFVLNDDLIINELAPRVHNSGHWTQIGSVTCQFENHIRALAGIALGSTETLGNVGMLNLIGTDIPTLDEMSQTLGDSSKLYWYNKVPRPGRKLGHINFLALDSDCLAEQMKTFDML